MVKDFDILDFEEAGPGLAFTSDMYNLLLLQL